MGHFPSPLALEFRIGSPEAIAEAAEATRRNSLGHAAEVLDPMRGPPCEVLPGAFERCNSPPLPAVHLDAPVGRRRAGSFSASPQDELDSPSSRYLATEDSNLTSLFGSHSSSTNGASSPPLLTNLVPMLPAAVPNRSRSRSFTSDRNFAPIPPSLSRSPQLPLLHQESPEAPIFISMRSPSPTHAPVDTLATSIPGDLLFDDLPAPSSPHGAGLALPPPLIAPAPLPPHLGGPQLSTTRHGSGRTARAIASHALAAKTSVVAGSEHVPKRHSPLASPSIQDEREEMDFGHHHHVEPDAESDISLELFDAEHTDLHSPTSQSPHLRISHPSPPKYDVESPYGSPDDQQLESYLALHSELTLALSPRRGEPALPPTSGWDADEDDGDDLSTIDGFLAEVDSRFVVPRMAPLDSRLYDLPVGDAGDVPQPGELLDLASYNALHARSLSPPPHLDGALVSEDATSARDSLGLMEVDSPSSLGLEKESLMPSVALLHDASSVDMVRESELSVPVPEEGLSALERIFICAKSDQLEERSRVAHNLAEWILNVDICEAVEYVLPLLPGLATDSDELVKEILSPQLDRIMWHFFSRCSLLELDSPRPESRAIFGDSITRSRYESDSRPPSRPSSLHSTSDESLSPPTSKTSPANTEIADPPRISATTFTSLLGALLTDQSSLVAKSTQAALVRFLCRLKGKPLLPEAPRDHLAALHEPMPNDPESHTHLHAPYEISLEACQVLEDEFVTGIVLGLARLDDDDRDTSQSMDGLETTRANSKYDPSASAVLSPEEEQIGDDWLAAAVGDDSTSSTFDQPLRSFFDDAMDHVSKPMVLAFEHVPSTSPPVVNFEPIYSSFSPDPQEEEESAIGKMVSMGLIGAIATADCLEPDVLVTQILPEVDRMKKEPMFYVRKEAVQALGSLARMLPLEVFETAVLPLHATFARDTLWHVRRAACLALPAVCKRLPLPLLRATVVSNIQFFAADAARSVRSGALEVCGELIYLFHADPEGVPPEVLAFFLGQASNAYSPSTAAVLNPFAPIASVLDSPGEGYYDGPPSWLPTQGASLGTDPDRPVMCAFNMPAVVLTLGRAQWPLLRGFYLELSRDKTDKVRQSLASSLHEIIQIIGSAYADEALLEPFMSFLGDYEHIQSSVLEHLTTIVLSFGVTAASRVIEQLTEHWSKIRNWRMREKVAKDLRILGARFIMHEEGAESVLRLIARAFKDPVAAVRDDAVHIIPPMFAATAGCPLARARLLAFLSVFGEDSAYRNRVVYTACAATCVRNGATRDQFESCFLDNLARLARDPVVSVRIGVSRVIAAACEISHLYAGASDRGPLVEVLSSLATSTDRDVRVPILPFYTPSPASSPTPSSPGPTLVTWNRSSASRMLLEDREDALQDDNSLDMSMELCGEEDDVEMVEVPLEGTESIGQRREFELDWIDVGV